MVDYLVLCFYSVYITVETTLLKEQYICHPMTPCFAAVSLYIAMSV